MSRSVDSSSSHPPVGSTPGSGLVPPSSFRMVRQPAAQAGSPDAPVTHVSYDDARTYAKSRGGRLLTSDEWDAAAVTPRFVVQDGILEWVESPDAAKTVRQHGASCIVQHLEAVNVCQEQRKRQRLLAARSQVLYKSVPIRQS